MLSKYALLQFLFCFLGASQTTQILYNTTVSVPLSYNITVSFFPQTDELTCQANDISNAITLTSNNIAPSHYTCFDLDKLFSQEPSNTTYQGILPSINYTRIKYALSNAASFNTSTNYTRVWYDLGGSGSDSKEKPTVVGSHTIYSYAFPACRVKDDNGLNTKDNPWFTTKCQSKKGGECKSVPHRIRSFAIFSASGNVSEEVKCEKSGTAPALGRQMSAIVAIAAAVAVFLVI